MVEGLARHTVVSAAEMCWNARLASNSWFKLYIFFKLCIVCHLSVGVYFTVFGPLRPACDVSSPSSSAISCGVSKPFSYNNTKSTEFYNASYQSALL